MKTSAGQGYPGQVCVASHKCHCGTGRSNPHVIGDEGCVRRMVPSPEPLGKDPDTGFDMWLVDGQLITDYTMRQQRGYHQHECGCWSRSPGSTNSLSDET